MHPFVHFNCSRICLTSPALLMYADVEYITSITQTFLSASHLHSTWIRVMDYPVYLAVKVLSLTDLSFYLSRRIIFYYYIRYILNNA